jgi:hypothetical protein
VERLVGLSGHKPSLKIRWKAEAFGMELVDQALMLSTPPLSEARACGDAAARGAPEIAATGAVKQSWKRFAAVGIFATIRGKNLYGDGRKNQHCSSP